METKWTDALLDTMRQTDDPLLLGPVPAPDGAELNDPAGVSAAESPSHEAAVR